MTDKIIRGTCANEEIRWFAVDSTNTVKEIINNHNCSITTGTALGRLISAGLLMGITLKNKKDLLTIKISGNGPAKNLIVTANNKGKIKGLVTNPEIELPLTEAKTINVKNAIGDGTLTVIKDMGLKQPYVGTCELISGEIAEDLSYYFSKSEQISTAVGLGVLLNKDGTIRKAGGFLIQLMPNTDESNIELLEKSLANFPNISDLLDMGFSIEHIVKKILLKNFQIKITDTTDAKFECDCSHNKFLGGIKMLSNLELKEMVEKDEDIVAVCHFCNKKYSYKPQTIKKIIEEKQEIMKQKIKEKKHCK